MDEIIKTKKVNANYLILIVIFIIIHLQNLTTIYYTC